jgi:hypothetical protein
MNGTSRKMRRTAGGRKFLKPSQDFAGYGIAGPACAADPESGEKEALKEALGGESPLSCG